MQEEHYIQLALKCAHKASDIGEVPVGAVVVYEDKVIAQGWNQPISTNDPTAHAEIVAMRNAAKELGNYRLTNSTLYVTLEPCTMCVGAIIHARIGRLVFGAYDPKVGAVESQLSLLSSTHFNHTLEFVGGVLKGECSECLTDFFKGPI